MCISFHLFAQNLIRDSWQSLLICSFLNLRVFGHIDQSTVKNNLSLKIICFALNPERLYLSFILQHIQKRLSVMINIAQNYSLIFLPICHRQLLKSDLVLLRQSNGHVIFILRNRNDRLRLSSWRLAWISSSWLSNRLSRDSFDPHGHRYGRGYLLEGLWSDRFWRLVKFHRLMENGWRPFWNFP